MYITNPAKLVFLPLALNPPITRYLITPAPRNKNPSIENHIATVLCRSVHYGTGTSSHENEELLHAQDS